MIDFSQLPKFKGSQFAILSLIPEWAAAHQCPIEAIELQIGVAHVWIMSNKRRAPKKDYTRFLNHWMQKAKDYGNLRVPVSTPPRPPDVEPDMTLEELREIRRQNFPKYKPDPVKFTDSITTELVNESEEKPGS